MAEIIEETQKQTVTEEIAAKYRGKGKGRIPKAIVREVVKLNRKHKEDTKPKPIVELTDKGVVKRDRLDLFIDEFLANGGNATRAAMKVGNFANEASAAVMGSRYLSKAKSMGRIYLEKKGYGYGKLLEVAAEKMLESKTPEWWDRLMKIAEYADFISKEKQSASVNVNVMQAHKSLTSEYIEEGEVMEEAEEREN